MVMLIPLPKRIMMHLSRDKLQDLQSLWLKYPDGLDLKVFAQLMLDAVECRDDDKYELLYGALKLFAEIDINGDQSMEWSEFMQFMIDAASANRLEDPGVTVTQALEL